MLNRLGKKGTVGLEMNDTHLKAVELAKKGGQAQLVNYGSQPLPGGIIQDGVVVNKEALGSALSEFWQKQGFQGRDVVIGISNQEILVRFASLPKVEQTKLDSMVKFQAQELLPLDISAVVFDYSVIGEKEVDENPMWEILLVAGKSGMIYDFIDALEIAKLNIKEIEVLPLSLMRMLSAEDQGQVVTVVDISGGVNNLLVLNEGTPRLARMMPTFESTREDTSQDPVEDEAGTGDGADQVAASREVTLEEPSAEAVDNRELGFIVNNIRMSIDFYQSQNQEDPVDGIFISGSGARNDDLKGMLSAELMVPVESVEPLSTMEVEESVRMASEKEFALCISLAYRGLEVD